MLIHSNYSIIVAFLLFLQYFFHEILNFVPPEPATEKYFGPKVETRKRNLQRRQINFGPAITATDTDSEINQSDFNKNPKDTA